eukprot:TRINITY_DN1479_c0_g1_i2.p2 TRINITY_DN1479_c0_g1~~TRINITY_DN1479_c0_g1_i2.p2  ORF type:complete len:280 (-),score=81.74 TRINITY_DN1479_c0_g1_i2:55-894(-)
MCIRDRYMGIKGIQMSNTQKIINDLKQINLDEMTEDGLRSLGNDLQDAYSRLLGGLDLAITDLLSANQGGEQQSLDSNLAPNLENVADFANVTIQQYGQQLEQKKSELKKLSDFKANSKKYFEGKEKEIKDRQKQVDMIMGSIKGVLSNIKPKELAKMKVTPGSIAEQFWKKMFKLLYNEDETKFNWSKFKKYTLEKDNGQEFQKRIVSFDVERLTEEQSQIINFLKTDTKVQEWASRDPQGELALDVFEWIDYIPSASSQYEEYRACLLYTSPSPRDS